MAVKKSQSRRKIGASLRRSLSDVVPVRITRTVVPNEALDGIVLDLAPDWVLLAQLRGGGYFDGYCIVRRADLRRVETRTTFLPFLREHQPWPPAKPAGSVDLSGPHTFIADAARYASVVSLYEEARRPDMCWIGSPEDWGEKSAWILTIEPDATWDGFITRFKFKHLTRVDFADDYNNAVLTLAGPKPLPTTAHGRPALVRVD
jgi:hypothetical protein